MSTADVPANPFAPTPLGKGWTPPKQHQGATETGVVDAASPAGLDDLFGGENVPAGDTPETAPAGGLDDLFEETAGKQSDEKTSTAPTADTTETAPAGGLDDLFEETAEKEHDAKTPIVPPARPRVRRRGVPASLRAAKRQNAPAETPSQATPGAESSPTRGPAGARPVDTPATTLSATTLSATDRSDAGRPSVTKTPGGTPVRPPAAGSRRSLFSYGEEEIARAWRIVDQTLAIVQTDMALQEITAGAVLTTDPAEYASRRSEIHGALRRKMAAFNISPSGVVDIETILDLVVDEISGISVLGELFRDPDVDEILVDRWDVVSVERGGILERTPIRFRDPQHAESCARSLALKVSDRAVSRAIPLVTAELPSARVTFAFGAVVKGGLSITVRKFRPLLGLDELLRYGSLNDAMATFLREAVRARAGILVSGGTGTGKTTIINLLSSFIPDTERVVSIEDAFELKLANTHVVSLQTKEASSLDDTVSVTLAELLRNTLRMRPDRIIVGEIREGAGTMVMLSAASTGHDGTLTTVHANSADGAVNERLPDLVRQARGGVETDTILRSILNAFDLVVHVSRTRDGRRYLSEISALAGVEPDKGRIRLLPVFTGRETTGGIEFTSHGLDPATGLAERMDRRTEA